MNATSIAAGNYYVHDYTFVDGYNTNNDEGMTQFVIFFVYNTTYTIIIIVFIFITSTVTLIL